MPKWSTSTVQNEFSFLSSGALSDSSMSSFNSQKLLWPIDPELPFLLSSLFQKSFESSTTLGGYESTNWYASYAGENEHSEP